VSHIKIPIVQLSHAEGLELPFYATDGAAGMDLKAALTAPVTLKPMARALIETGLSIALPQDYEAQIRPRSGLAAKNGITVLNTPGTIDSDYRGELKIILINLGDEDFDITRDMRIAQMIIAPVVQARLQETDSLSDTVRGAGGFGSTGTDAKGAAK